MPLARTEPLRREMERDFPSRPFTVDFWDGTSLPSTGNGGPRFSVRSPKALAHALMAPGQLGLGRAYVSGALDVNDLDGVIRLVDTWQPPDLDLKARARLALAAAQAAGLQRPPSRPTAEVKLHGSRHTRERDSRAVRHHYDVSNDFFALFLDESMTYSCAIFSRGASTLEEAQEAKLELVCTKLALGPDDTVLDVGCGWGSFAIHAAGRHGSRVVGITLSPPQAELARRRVAEAGLSDRVDIRVADYRQIEGERFDAIASIGMVEHVGRERIDEYASRLASLLRPGGRLLNHGIARLRPERRAQGAFSQQFIFPDGDPLPLSGIQLALERAGFETEQVEGFRSDYAETLRNWIERFDSRFDDAVRLAGSERARVWRLYLRGARNVFVNRHSSVYQVRCRLRDSA